MFGIVLFCGAIEANRYYNFAQLRDRLRLNKTPLSANFDRREWFGFFVERATRDIPAFRRMMEYAFWNTPFHEIDKESMKVALYTLASGSELHDINDTDYKRLADKIVETMSDSDIQRDELIPFIRINNLTINHVPSTPLFQIYPVHLIFQMGRLYGDISLREWTRREKENGFVFHRRTFDKQKTNKLLFLHGVGLGVVPYLKFINKFAGLYGEIIIVEFPGISRNTYEKSYYPTAQEIVDTIVNEFVIGHDVVDAIGHSYGSLVLSYIANKAPRLLNKRVYLDTPAFFPDSVKFWPQVFRPITWSYIFDLIQKRNFAKAMREFIFAEQWNQHLMHNATYFYEYCNLEYNLDANTMILLGAKDNFINAYNIQRYMEEYYPNVVIQVDPKGRHGDAIRKVDEIVKFIV
jgi:pimeloyl-ACP methyl ester carboxylesterase